MELVMPTLNDLRHDHAEVKTYNNFFRNKDRSLYYQYTRVKKVEQVDRDTAIYDGKRIKLERADKLVAGQYYIRFFIGNTGSHDPEVFKIVGRQYANREYHYGMCIKVQSQSSINRKPRRAFLSDLGFATRKSKDSQVALYRFAPSAFAFLEDISKRDMVPEILKLMHGFDVDVKDKMDDMKQSRIEDEMMSSLYGY